MALDLDSLDLEGLLTAGEVAKLVGVTPRTVARWGTQGKLAWIRTPGGRRRYREIDVLGMAGQGWLADR